jgi:hypothetical protein
VQQSFFDRLEGAERWLRRLLIVALISLVTLQFLFARDPYPLYLSFAQRMEGLPWTEEAAMGVATGSGVLQISRSGRTPLPEASVVINGQTAANFAGRTVSVTVRQGDRVVIDARGYPRAVFVVSGGSGVGSPPLNLRVETVHSTASLGQVKLK